MHILRLLVITDWSAACGCSRRRLGCGDLDTEHEEWLRWASLLVVGYIRQLNSLLDAAEDLADKAGLDLRVLTGQRSLTLKALDSLLVQRVEHFLEENTGVILPHADFPEIWRKNELSVHVA